MAAGLSLYALIWGFAFCYRVNCFSSSKSHFFRTMYTSVTEASQGLPQFTAVAFVDDQLLARYESTTKKMIPHIAWMKAAATEDPKYLHRYTQVLQHDEDNFKGDLVMLQKRYNLSEGLHTVQMMILCEVRPDGSKGGQWRYGYNGRDFIGFDMESLEWTAADPQAQIVKRSWESETGLLLRLRSYMEETCEEWMQRDMTYRDDSLPRTVAPITKVTKKPDYGGLEMLICQAYGFYPQEIDAFWTKDGEVWIPDTFHRAVAPNSDGTYHTWIGIKIDPKDRDRYRCRIEHDGLEKPLDLAWEEPVSTIGTTFLVAIGCIVPVIAAIVLAVVFTNRRGRNRENN